MTDVDSLRLFSDYMMITRTPCLTEKPDDDPLLNGKVLGVVNGNSWVSLWSTWFGRKILPGVKIINTGNDAVQLNFMRAYKDGKPCPPQINIDLFCKYAKDLYDLFSLDAILISCSTMNRAFKDVSKFMEPFGVPVVQIDEAMMEEAVNAGGKILVIATHGPTVKSTQSLLSETAGRLHKKIDFIGLTIEKAFDVLGKGEIEKHNEIIANAIIKKKKTSDFDTVVLAQLSMSVFSFSYPDPVKEFGIKVLNSGETGFQRVKQILISSPKRNHS